MWIFKNINKLPKVTKFYTVYFLGTTYGNHLYQKLFLYDKFYHNMELFIIKIQLFVG